MSTTAQSLAIRFRELMLSGKWIANTNFKEKLAEIDWKQAINKVEDLNTIAALTFHMNYYVAGVLQVYRGGELTIRDKYSFDCPVIVSQRQWQKLKADLMAHSEAYAVCIEQLTEAQLSEPFVDEKYGSHQRNIEAMIEHGYYHLGQISLIQKLT